MAIDHSFCLTLSKDSFGTNSFQICTNNVGEKTSENVWAINCAVSLLNQNSDMIKCYTIQNNKLLINLCCKEGIKYDVFRKFLHKSTLVPFLTERFLYCLTCSSDG